MKSQKAIKLKSLTCHFLSMTVKHNSTDISATHAACSGRIRCEGSLITTCVCCDNLLKYRQSLTAGIACLVRKNVIGSFTDGMQRKKSMQKIKQSPLCSRNRSERMQPEQQWYLEKRNLATGNFMKRV